MERIENKHNQILYEMPAHYKESPMLFVVFAVSSVWLASFYVYISQTRQVKKLEPDAIQHKRDFYGEKIGFAKPPVVEGKKITAVIAVNKLRSLKYEVAWCKQRDAPDMNTWGQVERSEPGGEMSRLANVTMESNNPHTQSVWTRESLQLPLERDDWLEIPRDRESLVTLEISLLKRPAVWSSVSRKNGEGHVNDQDLPDMIFHFKFTLDMRRKAPYDIPIDRICNMQLNEGIRIPFGQCLGHLARDIQQRITSGAGD
ncbi:hypothetical protein C8R45DRAFT_1149885 [Mycena sanguinolenta]|nr:hypothetical protein C8R45DRAFT_1149885 [Mycena sanguinolenta]